MTETRFVTNHRDAQRATRLPRQKFPDMARRMPQRQLETDQVGNPDRPQTRVAVFIATRCRAINPAPWRGQSSGQVLRTRTTRPSVYPTHEQLARHGRCDRLERTVFAPAYRRHFAMEQT